MNYKSTGNPAEDKATESECARRAQTITIESPSNKMAIDVFSSLLASTSQDTPQNPEVGTDKDL